MRAFSAQRMREGAALLAVCALAGGLWCSAPALAAENELRLPVEKTARISPVGEPADAKAAKSVPAPADRAADEKGPALKAPKTNLAKAAEAAAANPVPTPPPGEPKAAKQAAPKPAPKPEAKPAAKPAAAPAPRPEPAPKPAKPSEPPADPLASKRPVAPLSQPEAALPAEGRWVGALSLEYHADRVVLRAPTSAQVERVTWFLVADREGVHKLAADLRGPWRKKGGGGLSADRGPVKAVAVGEHPDRLRLAVEFRQGAVRSDMEPVVERGPQGVTVTIPLAVRLAP